MEQTVWRKGSFASCHRIMHHKSKCRNLHGHNYNYEIGISYNPKSSSFNECNYVIDFGDIKKKYIEVIDKFFDHSVIANEEDADLIALAKKINDPTRIITTKGDPSVEIISQLILYLCYRISRKYNPYIYVDKIRIYETDNSCCDLTVGIEELKNIHNLEKELITPYYKFMIDNNI